MSIYNNWPIALISRFDQIMPASQEKYRQHTCVYSYALREIVGAYLSDKKHL